MSAVEQRRANRERVAPARPWRVAPARGGQERRWQHDSGSATIWATALCSLLALAFLAAAAVSQAVIARHRASAAADLAALAAVGRAAEGSATACAAAAQVAAAARARVAACVIRADSVVVRVETYLAMPLIPAGPATAAARAGPVDLPDG